MIPTAKSPSQNHRAASGLLPASFSITSGHKKCSFNIHLSARDSHFDGIGLIDWRKVDQVVSGSLGVGCRERPEMRVAVITKSIVVEYSDWTRPGFFFIKF